MLEKKYTLEDYMFDLPQELIAQEPLKNRSSSRLLVIDRKKGNFYEKKFSDLPEILKEKYLFVRNNTRVLNARFFGEKLTGAKVEIFLLKKVHDNLWEVLAKPGKRLKPGAKVILDGGAEILIKENREEGIKIIETNSDFDEEYIKKYGNIPLPPYIKKGIDNPERYQTIFSKQVNSVAAPTAGLHFTPEIISKLKENKMEFTDVNLGIGLGTFRPLSNNIIESNSLHTEEYYISPESAEKINKHKNNKGKIMAVGTTSVRTLEACYKENGEILSEKRETDIFIYPGFKFNVVDSMITNFHLPGSSLIVMISAFAGYDLVMDAYKYAVDNKFRFFSFGDCMLIL